MWWDGENYYLKLHRYLSDPTKQQIRRVAELERENQRLRERLAKAETIIDVQKKVSSLLGITLNQRPTDVSD